MDRLKFRVWDNETQSYEQNLHHCFLNSKGELFDRSEYDKNERFVLYPAVNKSVELCTGLKEKNGNLIYEGDIVDVLPEVETTGVVKWSDDLARFTIIYENICCDFDNYYGYDLEIIGNIHENPELMEEVK